MSERKSGKYVLRLRKLTGKKQRQFAEVLGIDRSYISQLENDYWDVSLSKFIEWCEIFNISPKQIFDEKKWK